MSSLFHFNIIFISSILWLCDSGYLVYSTQLTQSEFEILKDYAVYYSQKQTKEVLMKYYNRSDEIKQLVDEYDFRCGHITTFFKKNYPFITVEGPYRKTRDVVAQRLAKRIRARVVGNPPQFMTMTNYIFNDTIELRRAFYSLGVYGAACRALEFLSVSPVVMAGYWVDQTSFGISKMFEELPPKNSNFYEWPEDLLKPDMVFVINPASNFPPIPLHPYKPLPSYSFKDKLLDALLRFRNPSPTEINAAIDKNNIVNTIIKYINRHLHKKYVK